MEKIVTVKELKKLFVEEGKQIEIDTPDGYIPITKWFDKGKLPMVLLKTNHHETKCAYNHLIEKREDNQMIWVLANELEIGDEVLTESGYEKIIEKLSLEDEECYDFTVDSENHRYWGDGFSSHNSGKSYFCSANCVKEALKKGIQVILIDTEDRLSLSWMKKLGVDVDSPLLQRIQTNSIENVMQIVSEVSHMYKDENEGVPLEEQSGLLFVIDSLGALFPSDELSRMEDGDLSPTDGMRRAGALTRMMNTILAKIAATKMGCLCTNHVYAATDQYSDDTIPGGKKLIFLSTQIVQMNKFKLKAKDLESETDEDTKDSDVVGIRAKCKVYKSSWNKSQASIEVQIPYEEGMNPYSGLFDLFTTVIKVNGNYLLQKEGNRYAFYDPKTGEQVWIKFRKNITNDDWDTLMNAYNESVSEESKNDSGEA